MKVENSLIKGLIKKRKLIMELATNDFKARYASSFLGMIWAYILPLTNILVFWFVFQMGLKNSAVKGYAFIVWYIPAFLAWNFFSDAFIASANSIREYGYLVKKVNFPVFTIPFVKIVSGFFVHIVFVGVIIIINLVYGIYPSIYYLQVFYYLFCTVVLLMGLAWLFSALGCIIPDILNGVNVVLQLGFWATPIIWDPSNMSGIIQKILKLNPLFYVCQGYRDTFIYGVWFWEYKGLTVYYWIVTLIILGLGIYTFKKLQPRFADVI